MRPLTSFEIHAATISQKLDDAKAALEGGAHEDARRLQREIATMRFGGETAHETYSLLQKVDRAVSEIGALLDGAAA